MAAAGEVSVPAVAPSRAGRNTVNPIRAIVDELVLEPNPDLTPVKLSIGDPTVFGNFRPPSHVEAELKSFVDSCEQNGYVHSAGKPEAREAIARTHSVEGKDPLTAGDVFITSGCSGAIELAMTAVADPGDVFLIPVPGFSLYETVARAHDFTIVPYPLLPEQEWDVDLERFAALLEEHWERLAGVVIVSPSNPCGSCFSRFHLEQLAGLMAVFNERRTAAGLGVTPILADEIYAWMTFDADRPFTPIASVTAPNVPVLAVGGLAKRYVVPGWRVGWVVVHGVPSCVDAVKIALLKLSQVILGANVLCQAVVPSLLLDTPESYYTNMLQELKTNADACFEMLDPIEGLRPVKPRGAMYMLVGIDKEVLDFEDDMDFTQKLVREQSVFVLPGQCFRYPNFFRIVFAAPVENLREAMERIAVFCSNHHRSS